MGPWGPTGRCCSEGPTGGGFRLSVTRQHRRRGRRLQSWSALEKGRSQDGRPTPGARRSGPRPAAATRPGARSSIGTGIRCSPARRGPAGWRARRCGSPAPSGGLKPTPGWRASPVASGWKTGRRSSMPHPSGNSGTVVGERIGYLSRVRRHSSRGDRPPTAVIRDFCHGNRVAERTRRSGVRMSGGRPGTWALAGGRALWSLPARPGLLALQPEAVGVAAWCRSSRPMPAFAADPCGGEGDAPSCEAQVVQPGDSGR